MRLHWKQVIRSDVYSFTLFQPTGLVFVCRKLAKAFHVACLVTAAKHGGGSVIGWGAISSCKLGHLVFCRRMITGNHYRSIVANHPHIKLQNLSLGECLMFQDDSTPLWIQACLHGPGDNVIHQTWCP
ncbi:transposable element Tcb1 transposase [Trichonephila clavipes]|nr:transposable element Tcb1 transposase [Trichonephila clavipes]